MATGTQDILSRVDLTDESYTVEQSLIRSKYKAMDRDGNVVLRAKKKKFSIKDRFPFQNADGEDAFEVKSASALDMNLKRDYVLIDSATDEEVLWLDVKFSLVGDKWQIRDPESQDVVVTIESQSKLASIARGIHPIFGFIPHKYDISTADGRKIGSIEGQLALKDIYEVRVEETEGVSREAVVAAAMVIDAIEGN